MIRSDLAQLAGAILLIIGALLPVVNPLGDAPIFLRLTPGCDEPTRAFLANRIAFYSFFMVLGSLLLGSFVLLMFGLSIPVVQVAGGAVVCALGWKVLAEIGRPSEAAHDLTLPPRPIAIGRAFTPLTVPMTIDGGVISVAITVGANHAHKFSNMWLHPIALRRSSARVTIALAILLTDVIVTRNGSGDGSGSRVRWWWCVFPPSSWCVSGLESRGMASRRCWPKSAFRR